MYVGGRAVCGRSVFMGEARGVNTTQAALRSGAKLNAWEKRKAAGKLQVIRFKE